MSAIKWAYQRYVEKEFPLPSEESLTLLENRIGRKFPEHYRDYLLKFNGGIFNEPDIRITPNGEGVDRLTFMYGIKASDDFYELATEDILTIWDDNLPPQIVPVGCTMMGCFIMIITHEEEFGTVFYRTPTQSFFLADNMEDFFALLKNPEQS